jgi:uncharacterized protein (DUF1015 family)
MLTYVDAEAVDRCVAAVVSGGEPRFRFEADDVVHEVWDVTDVEALRGAFEGVERVYVADGHHRCAAASRAAAELGEVEGVEIFPAVLFPMGQMKIWPYHRVVWDGGDDVLERVRARVSVRAGQARPSGPGRVGMFADGAWWELDLPETRSEDTAARLDVARLAEFVLGPVFGIEDPRTDRRLSFVGGIRGTGALEAAVVKEGASVAFSMWETSMEEFRAVSDAGELMPPKSTWFEPKLRSGILVHRFGEDDR